MDLRPPDLAKSGHYSSGAGAASVDTTVMIARQMWKFRQRSRLAWLGKTMADGPHLLNGFTDRSTVGPYGGRGAEDLTSPIFNIILLPTPGLSCFYAVLCIGLI